MVEGKQSTFFQGYWWQTIVILVILGLSLTSLYSYLLFHSLAEIFSIAVAFAIFMIAWNARRFSDNNFFLFIGIGFLFVAFIDILHLLAYKGMAIFPDDANLPTQLWLAAKYVQAGTLLLAPAFLRRKLPIKTTLAAFAIISVALVASIFLHIFPDAFIEGTGLTTFKIASEYIVCTMMLAGAYLLWRNRESFSQRILQLLLAAIALMILGELAFTIYNDVYGIINMSAHLLIIISFYLLYQAMIVTSLMQPYELLFRDLKRSEQQLKRLNTDLEWRVEERTKQLAAANEQLIRKEKLASLGQLAGSVSHDLRNPLGNISNSAYYLRIKLGDNPEYAEQLNILQQEIEHCNSIINDLLEFSRTNPLQLQRADLNHVVAASLSSITKPPKIKIKLQLGKLPPAMIDENKIRRVLINMITNAYQAMPKSGTLQITTLVHDKDIMVEIKDSGIGISAANQKRLFEPLFTTKKHGVGLGLALCKEIIAKHGGRITVRSRQGSGTTFTIILPRTHANTAHR